MFWCGPHQLIFVKFQVRNWKTLEVSIFHLHLNIAIFSWNFSIFLWWVVIAMHWLRKDLVLNSIWGHFPDFVRISINYSDFSRNIANRFSNFFILLIANVWFYNLYIFWGGPQGVIFEKFQVKSRKWLFFFYKEKF